MSDSFYHITQSIKLKNNGSKHIHVGQPCLGIFAMYSMYSASTSDVIKSYLTCV